jgi:hypothetical protein
MSKLSPHSHFRYTLDSNRMSAWIHHCADPANREQHYAASVYTPAIGIRLAMNIYPANHSQYTHDWLISYHNILLFRFSLRRRATQTHQLSWCRRPQNNISYTDNKQSFCFHPLITGRLIQLPFYQPPTPWLYQHRRTTMCSPARFVFFWLLNWIVILANILATAQSAWCFAWPKLKAPKH